MSEDFLREQKTLHILLFLFFLQSRSRRGSRNSITEEKKRGGKFKKKSKRKEKERKRRAHFRRDAQRNYLRPAIAFAGGTKRQAGDAHLIRNRGIVCA